VCMCIVILILLEFMPGLVEILKCKIVQLGILVLEGKSCLKNTSVISKVESPSE